MPQPASPPPVDPHASRRPILVAHRGGNSRRALHAALDAGVDWLETDVWWEHGRIVARHDPRLWRLPVTHHRGRIRLVLRRALTLEGLLDDVAGSDVRLLLDLKGSDPRLAPALVEALRHRGALARAALCGQVWTELDAARVAEPGLQVFFSLGREESLPAYERRLADGSAPPLASISYRLLTAERVAALKQRGVTMIVWTVNDAARARRLLDWGADGITSDSPALLRSLRHPPPAPTPARRSGERRSP